MAHYEGVLKQLSASEQHPAPSFLEWQTRFLRGQEGRRGVSSICIMYKHPHWPDPLGSRAHQMLVAEQEQQLRKSRSSGASEPGWACQFRPELGWDTDLRCASEISTAPSLRQDGSTRSWSVPRSSRSASLSHSSLRNAARALVRSAALEHLGLREPESDQQSRWSLAGTKD